MDRIVELLKRERDRLMVEHEARMTLLGELIEKAQADAVLRGTAEPLAETRMEEPWPASSAETVANAGGHKGGSKPCGHLWFPNADTGTSVCVQCGDKANTRDIEGPFTGVAPMPHEHGYKANREPKQPATETGSRKPSGELGRRILAALPEEFGSDELSKAGARESNDYKNLIQGWLRLSWIEHVSRGRYRRLPMLSNSRPQVVDVIDRGKLNQEISESISNAAVAIFKDAVALKDTTTLPQPDGKPAPAVMIPSTISVPRDPDVKLAVQQPATQIQVPRDATAATALSLEAVGIGKALTEPFTAQDLAVRIQGADTNPRAHSWLAQWLRKGWISNCGKGLYRREARFGV